MSRRTSRLCADLFPIRRWRALGGFVLGSACAAGNLLTWATLSMTRTAHAAPSTGKESDPAADASMAALLEPVRQKYALPALGGAIIDGAGMRAVGVVGERVRGQHASATIDDVWHLGSDTKAMTATMVAALVEHGKLSWDSRLSESFAEMKLPPQTAQITLLQLLTHRAGLPANTEWNVISKTGSLVDQRRAAVARLASTEILSAPGETFAYSNWGYVVAAAMAEQATGKSYEALMKEFLFDPLHMGSAGYGAAGTPGKADQPWGHSTDGVPAQSDNPLVMAPAGGVHCSLGDWGRFLSDQLRGAEGKPALLRPESYSRMHSAPPGGTYALGWGVLDRPWGGGRVFTHAGSNTLNVAIVWMAPARDFAVVAVCNQGGSEKACHEVAGKLIARHGEGSAAQ
jgi:CubicO group peptidase (beta-lactamase class C family)